MADKVAAGRARKEEKKNALKDKEEMQRQAAEDASWEEGAKKGNKKKEAEAEKAAAKAARKAEADAEAAAEEASFAEKKRTGKSSANKAGSGKMTRAEIAAKIMKQQEEEAKAKAKEKKEVERSGGNDYMGALVENTNKEDDISASGIEDAISALSTDAATTKGRVNLKAEYKKFEEAHLAFLKEEQPGLKLSQYKERCWQAWQKSPDNPQNQQ
ncbi:hypothetical protein AB1Y20_001190 [Prymnesium parvum]|uniref:Coiled-coil domain-containing protein 124 n=1 Tax=Prymnesium parvum TaxID=97485 RepID=A0AB34KAW8_PRYPA